MQIITDVMQKSQEFLEDNASALLTAGGVVGVVGTGILAFRGGQKYQDILLDNVDELNAGLDLEDEEQLKRYVTVDKVPTATKIQWMAPHILPPIGTGAITIAAVILANRLSGQKAAALAAAYGMSQKHLDEYKNKVTEKLGINKEQKIQDELAQDRVNNTPGSSQIVVIEGEVLCFDQPTGRYFRGTMEGINRAVNQINNSILHHDHASASEFYEALGLPITTWSEEVGWNTDQLLEIIPSTVMTDDHRPCLAIDFKTQPRHDYIRPSYS